MFVRKLGGRADMAAAAKTEASPADLWHGDEAEAHLSQLAVLENFAAHGMFVKFTDEEAAALEGRALAIALSASKDVAKHGTTAATLRVAAPAASRGIGGAGGFGAPLPVSLPAEPLGRDGAEAVLKSLRPSGAVVDLPSSGSSRPGSAARRLLGSVLGGGKKGASVPAEAGEGGSVEAAASSKPFDEAEVAAAVAARRAEIEAELARKLAADEAASIRRREREEAAEAKRIAAEKAAEERRVAAEALAAKKREEAQLRAEAQGAKQKEAFEAAERKRRELELKKEQAAKAKAEADEARRVAAAEAAKEKEEAARVAAIAKAEADKELAARKLAEEKAAVVRKAEQEKELAEKKKAAAEAAALKKAAADKAAAERKEAADKAAAERKAAAEEAARIKAAAAEKAAKQRALAERSEAERRALDEAARKADAEAEAARDAATLKAVLADTRALRADLEMEALRAGKRASVSRRGADEAAAAAAGLRAMPSAARDAAVSEHAARLASRAALVVQQALADVKGLEEYVGLAVVASSENNKNGRGSKLTASAGAETIDARGAVVLVDAVVREALARANAEGGFSFELPPPKPMSRGHSPAVLVQRFRRSVPAPPPLPPRPKLELPEELQQTPRGGLGGFARRLGLTSQSEKVEVAETPRSSAARTPKAAAPVVAPAAAAPAARTGKHAGAAGFFLHGGNDNANMTGSSVGSFCLATAVGLHDAVTLSDSGSTTHDKAAASVGSSRSASRDEGEEAETFKTPRGRGSVAPTPRAGGGEESPLATPRKEAGAGAAPAAASAAAPATPDAVPTPPVGGASREGVPAQADALAAAATTAAAEARAASEAPTTRVRRARRSSRKAPASDDAEALPPSPASSFSSSLAPGLKRNANVADLFAELCAVMPDGVMEAEYAPPSAADSSPWVRGNRGGRDASKGASTDGLELAEQHAAEGGEGGEDGHDWAGDAQAVAAAAARHAKELRKIAAEVSAFSAVPSPPPGMTAATAVAALSSAVADARGRLQVLCVPPAAVLAHLASERPGSWPAAKWAAMAASADLHAELSELDKRQRRWVMQRGRAADEGRRVETFLDGVRARVAALERRYFAAAAAAATAATAPAAAEGGAGASPAPAPAPASVADGVWLPLGVPSDRAALARAKAASLHVASLYMSRVLFEVANLERAAGVAHAKCLVHVADAARVAHKAHALAGGFDAQSAELFDKVRSLARYYMRVLDPALVKSRALLEA